MRTAIWVLFSTVMISLAGCAGGGGGGGGGDDADGNDVSGTWAITEVVDDSDCGGGGAEVVSYTIDVAQNGSSLTVTANISGSNQTFSGSINGNTIQWSGSFPESGGTTTINSVNLTVNSDCSEIDGNSSWSWTDGSESCTGTSRISGVRTQGSGCGTTSSSGTNCNPACSRIAECGLMSLEECLGECRDDPDAQEVIDCVMGSSCEQIEDCL